MSVRLSSLGRKGCALPVGSGDAVVSPPLEHLRMKNFLSSPVSRTEVTTLLQDCPPRCVLPVCRDAAWQKIPLLEGEAARIVQTAAEEAIRS